MIHQNQLVTLITGANAGIGYYTARHLAVKGNFKVLVGSRSLSKAQDAIKRMMGEEQSIQSSALEPLEIDLTNDETISAAAEYIDKTYGALDILINNAGISGDPSLPQRENFQAVFNTNVTGTAMVTEAFIPLLRKSKAPAPGRRIVNVSSSLGSLTMTANGRAINPAYTPYSVSKAALDMLSLYTLNKVKDDKITVVLTTPGYCSTNLNRFRGLKDPALGALNTVHAATMGTFNDMNGKFTEELRNGEFDIIPF
jgi:NAD(P)-dependent dehydrogenase (short-subunit alcohol dehydrogenase family)